MTEIDSLSTRRLLLRPMSPQDAECIVRWRNSQHVAGMMMRQRKAELTPEEHLSWFVKTRHHRHDYIIELRTDRRPIGTVSLDWRACPRDQKCAEIGKLIGERSALGRGYAKEATIAWMQFAFDEAQFELVYSQTRADNVANLAINRTLGFRAESWPDWLEQPEGDWTFSVLTRDDWHSRKAHAEPQVPQPRDPG